jgi:alpha-D-ribose 1-methylphosphonate 5-triphosphate synthase subunit PhnG
LTGGHNLQRKRRTTILVKGDWQLAGALAGEITKKYDVQIIQQPNKGLVMLKKRESAQRKTFYLGEVLITGCKVQLGNNLGVGIIQDDHPDMAYNLAVIDVAYNAQLAETTKWEKFLLAQEKKILLKEAQELAKVLKTKVNFVTMDG